ADPVGCEQNKVVLARVVSKDARLHFIAGKSERMPACPSAESACRLRAYAVPGDEVLVDATEAPYLCAFFKSQTGRETRGWLPGAALQIAPSEGVPARQWAGKWQRDREAQRRGLGRCPMGQLRSAAGQKGRGSRRRAQRQGAAPRSCAGHWV